ncbi:MAG: Calx-beta domain-containing protein, partial [Verrucomicrobiota bacterium]
MMKTQKTAFFFAILAGLLLTLCLHRIEPFDPPEPDSGSATVSRSAPVLLSPAEAPPSIVLPERDHESLLEEAKGLEGTGIYRFAEAVPVDLHPANAGNWTSLPDGTEVWRLDLQSQGATSLNLGFTRYTMPAGGKLTLGSPTDANRFTFTEQDNEDHGELWTPIVAGDEIRIQVQLPPDQRSSLELRLTSVNHGFRSTISGGGSVSQACHIDVACGEDDLPYGHVIDAFRDQIRSVGRFTLNGVESCSGALVNNTAEDAKPFFLTAFHCGITPANAPSVVAYWNFQNSTCREPGSTESGQPGDGTREQFTTGATWRAEYVPADMTLIELDDSIDPEFDAFFAGWDRSGTTPEMSVGIHHPATAEKRISIDWDRPGSGADAHWTIQHWDHGNMEPGSSGSPLFDHHGRIIGQARDATGNCHTDELRITGYGRLSYSWTGAGTSDSRLSDWLDPLASGVMILDGLNANETVVVSHASVEEGSDGDRTAMPFTVRLNPAPRDEAINLWYSTRSDDAKPWVDYIPAEGILTFAPGEDSKTVEVTILGDRHPEEDEKILLVVENVRNRNDIIGEGILRNDDWVSPVLTHPAHARAIAGHPFAFQVTADHAPTAYSLSGPDHEFLSMDAESGRIEGTPADPGSFQITTRATNPAGSNEAPLTVTVEPATLQNALDREGLRWETGESRPWQLHTTVTA